MFNTNTGSLFQEILKELTTPYNQVDSHDDIIEIDDKFVVELELPGFKRSDVDITIKKDALTVEVRKELKEPEGRYIRQSRSHNEFTKIYRLGEGIDVDKIKATLTDGLLTITLPKGGTEDVQKIVIG